MSSSLSFGGLEIKLKIDSLSKELSELPEKLDGSTKQISDKIADLESKRTELLSLETVIKNIIEIYASSNIEREKNEIEQLQQHDFKQVQIQWRTLYDNYCGSYLKKIGDDAADENVTEAQLTKLEGRLKQLSKNPLVNDQQKETIKTISLIVKDGFLKIADNKNKEDRISNEAESFWNKFGSVSQMQAFFYGLNIDAQKRIFQVMKDSFEPAIQPPALDLGPFSPVPNVPLLYILDTLSSRDLLSLSQVNRGFTKYLDDMEVWSKYSGGKKQIQEDLSKVYFNMLQARLRKGVYVQKYIRTVPESQYAGFKSFLEENTFTFYFSKKMTIYNLNTDIEEMVKFESGIILHKEKHLVFVISGQNPNQKIDIYDLKTDTKIQSLEGINISEIVAVYKKGDIFMIGDKYGRIYVWDLKTGKRTATFSEGTLGARRGDCFCLVNHLLYTALEDGTIKILDLNTQTCTGTLAYTMDSDREIRRSQIFSLCKTGKFLFAGHSGRDGIIRAWDLTDNCYHILVGHQGPITALLSQGDFLFSASEDSTIQIWNLNNLQKSISLKTEGVVDQLCLNGNQLYSFSKKGNVELWDLTISYSGLLAAAEDIIQREDPKKFLAFNKVCRQDIYAPLPDPKTGGYTGEQYISILNGIYRVVLKEIVNRFNLGAAREAFALFKKLPDHVKIAVYENLSKIATLKSCYAGCAEHEFFGSIGQITDEERVQAINGASYLETVYENFSLI